MVKRDRDEADGRIESEYDLRLPEIDALKVQAVKNEADGHRDSRKMPFTFLHPEKDLLQHTGAWSRARTDDPFLFREVLYQVSYRSRSELLLRFIRFYQFLQVSGRREAKEPGRSRPRIFDEFVNDGAKILEIEVATCGKDDEPNDELAEHFEELVAAHGPQETVIILNKGMQLFELSFHLGVHMFLVYQVPLP